MLSEELTRGFWCECRVEDLVSGGRPELTTHFGAYSAAQADGWLSTALRCIAAALNPPTAMETWDGFYEGRIDTRRALLRAEPCTASIADARTRITWTIRPVRFLPLAARDEVELPACADDLKPHTTD
ncbi:hypothetical protein [Streptomyces kanamyceticus]|uniref:Uncharacterized protein n=1 Tax=Streptomyces kanamyceticus TaxID=1967 RepID=A0A5J6GEU7_STRKN|nr:hypothetical protein [Streptomyces kanamyceticus]QEU92992.1 hypothetical protein CP970_20590 [Streptomyces kanamyceticus]